MKYFAALLLLIFACHRTTASEDLLRKYAGVAHDEADTYIYFYAQGQKLNVKTQLPGKMRAYFLSTMAKPDLKNSCAEWDCFLNSIKAIEHKSRSPLYAYAIYHLADLAEKQNQFQHALQLIALITEMPDALERKVSLLKGRVLQFTSANDAAPHMRAHAKKFADAESLYFAAAALERARDNDGALALALRVLEKPEADAPFAQSGLLIRSILHQKIYAIGDTMQRIRLMEALRVAKDRASAQKLFDTLRSAKLSSDEALLFVQYGTRLMVDIGNFNQVGEIISAHGNEYLADANEKAALDSCERLLKKKQYVQVEALYALTPPTKARLQCRLRLAQRTGNFEPANQKIARDYIVNFDAESTLAERVFLRSCLPKGKEKTIALECLEELRAITAGKPIGAGARYYLAREYDAANQVDKVRVLLTEIATHYNDDYYFYRLIERPLGAQKAWSAEYQGGQSREDKILGSLLAADIARAKDITVTGALKDADEEIQKQSRDLSPKEQMALRLIAADGRDEARELLRGDEKIKIYKALIAIGDITGKSDISLFGVKQYLREKKIRPFLFEIPPHLLKLLYPNSFAAYVEKYATKQKLEVAEIFALIRQESQFFPGAISRANAQGLMQLMPATGRLVAAKEKMVNYNLLKAEDNIRLGTAFMRDLKNSYTADYVGLAIAYNAGPGRFIQWKKKYSEDDDIFIEEIPFQETYHYVRVLLADRAKYRALLK